MATSFSRMRIPIDTQHALVRFERAACDTIAGELRRAIIMAEAEPLEQLSINTIRTLAIDAVQRANSGHPGTPLAMAPVVYTLWQQFLRFDPEDPIWPNRDRFVLSSGH